MRSILLAIYKLGLKWFGGMGLQRVWPLGAIRDWLSGTLRGGKPEYVWFRGLKIFLDPNDNLELSIWGERWAKREIEFMKSEISPGDTIVDVGANIGAFTLLFSKWAKDGKVFAFEPAPGNLMLLNKNIEANGLTNITVVPQAVSDREGLVDLYLSDFNVGDHRIYNPEEKMKDWKKSDAVYDKLVSGKREAVKVPIISLDKFFGDYKKPISFIKIDVQGAEGGVLKGMKEVLQKSKNVKLITEFWPAGLKMFGVEAEEFLSIMSGLGFSIYELGESGPVNLAEKDSLLRKYTVENNLTTNLVFKR